MLCTSAREGAIYAIYSPYVHIAGLVEISSQSSYYSQSLAWVSIISPFCSYHYTYGTDPVRLRRRQSCHACTHSSQLRIVFNYFTPLLRGTRSHFINNSANARVLCARRFSLVLWLFWRMQENDENRGVVFALQTAKVTMRMRCNMVASYQPTRTSCLCAVRPSAKNTQTHKNTQDTQLAWVIRRHMGLMCAWAPQAGTRSVTVDGARYI